MTQRQSPTWATQISLRTGRRRRSHWMGLLVYHGYKQYYIHVGLYTSMYIYTHTYIYTYAYNIIPWLFATWLNA